MKRRWLSVLFVSGCVLGGEEAKLATTEAALSEAGPIRGSNTEASDEFGYSVAISADGSTLAVGAIGENGGGTGINQPDQNFGAEHSGAVYVFVRVNGTWVQQAYVKASNTGYNNWFGTSVALSADGSTLAVGAMNESSPATGVNGDQQQNGVSSGAVYVFTRKQGDWSQQAYIKGQRAFASAFGWRVALSSSGDTLAVGAPSDWGPDLANAELENTGSVYVFGRTGTNWRQEAYLQAAELGWYYMLGHSLAISADGTTIVAGSPGESSDGSNQHDTSMPFAGAAYVFARTKKQWHQQAYVKASNPDSGDEFGRSVALSPDGLALAATSRGEMSSATGVNGDQSDNSMQYAGAAYLFGVSGANWTQSAYVKASDTRVDNQFGYSVALSQTSLAVGAVGFANYSDTNLAPGSAYLFSRSPLAETAHVQSLSPTIYGQFGRAIAVTADGSTTVVGAPYESFGASQYAGAVYVFTP